MRFWIVLTFAALIAGCSSVGNSDKVTPPVVASTPDTTLALQPIDTVDVSDAAAADDQPCNDSLVAVMLEEARQHYLSASAAQGVGDSVRSTIQFEEAINILNDLGYCPDIESNRDFNDLSKAIIDDYETYIARTDSLNPESSIFALREKLTQFTEPLDSGDAGPPTEVLHETTIPLVINRLVEQNISFFQGKGREHMERWIRLSGKYFPIIQQTMREEHVPEEVAYLAMVESGLNPMARSWARAVGMWQFMKGTGRLYGLRATSWYDERRDFEKATRAAARHLKDLEEEFGDWYLALAAYNSGAGRVYRAIRRSRSTDFWEMRRYLPRETRNYVPSFIAAAIICLHPDAYGFHGIQKEPPLDFETVTIHDCVDLDVLARCADTEPDVLKALNPELIHWCTPPGEDNYVLRVPQGKADGFTEKYAAIPDDQKRDWVMHVVRRGETLGAISRKYGIATSVIMEVNKIRSARRLSIGKTLVIPIPRGSSAYAETRKASAAGYKPRTIDRGRVARVLAAARRVPAEPKNRVKVVYHVKKGDTIGHIAEWYGCRAANIRNWNDHPYGRPIRVGQTFIIWVDSSDAAKYRKIDGMTFEQKENRQPAIAENPDAYIIRDGDTLEKIASDHHVSIHQLKLWNNLRTSRIYAGQSLIIHPDAASTPVPRTASKSSGSSASVITYVVKNGDTLWDIARVYQVPETEIRKWNNLKRSTIYAGQELIIHTDQEDEAMN